ncbi:lipid II:glycine glycyltransferase FemX [Citrifermentans bremense]|uniref:lipid II:glycine glycyltransferase FemX n=1 Tax=Citrifermentans bremense TaxID=60035 RepID=UPI0004791197|nr:GNAT family N-acetyltransferase [Citrifermentans bremense]
MPNLTVKLIDPLKDAGVSHWLERCRETTIFHSASWARLMVDSYGYHPLYFMLYDSGTCRGCLPVMEVDSVFTGKRGVCLSFADYCGAIVEGVDDFALLLQAVLDYGRSRRWRYAEFRGEARLVNERASEVYAHHLIELSQDEELMLSRLRKSTARSIHKAVKEGVTVAIGTSLQETLEYYRLHCLTRRRQGLPPQPRRFFVNLHHHLIGRGLGFTAIARQGDATVAGVVCLHFGVNAIYKYGASDIEQQQLRANNLLFWELIKKCGRDGFRFLSLGRTDPKNEGLLNFKNGWGGNMSDLNYYRYDFTSGSFVAGEVTNLEPYRQLLRKLPVPLLRALGVLAYRHLG